MNNPSFCSLPQSISYSSWWTFCLPDEFERAAFSFWGRIKIHHRRQQRNATLTAIFALRPKSFIKKSNKEPLITKDLDKDSLSMRRFTGDAQRFSAQRARVLFTLPIIVRIRGLAIRRKFKSKRSLSKLCSTIDHSTPFGNWLKMCVFLYFLSSLQCL